MEKAMSSKRKLLLVVGPLAAIGAVAALSASAFAATATPAPGASPGASQTAPAQGQGSCPNM